MTVEFLFLSQRNIFRKYFQKGNLSLKGMEDNKAIFPSNTLSLDCVVNYLFAWQRGDRIFFVGKMDLKDKFIFMQKLFWICALFYLWYAFSMNFLMWVAY